MRKSTLIVVVIAAALVGFVYWHEFARAPVEKSEANPAVFHFQPEEVASLTLARPSGTIVLERKGTGWQIVQPIETRADKAAVNSLLDDVTLARASRTLTASAGELKNFGLAPPAVTMDFRLQNGQERQLKVGSADYSGNSAYAQAGGSKSVVLVPDSVLQDGSKTLADLRDNSVLGISGDQVESFDLESPSGNIEAKRSGSVAADTWAIDKPRQAAGDSTAIATLLGDVTNGKIAKVVSEDAAGLSRYGLEHPTLAFDVHLKSGTERALDLGRKEGDQYYARDSSRNMVFLVPASLEKQLDKSLFDLRDKQVLHGLPEDFTRVDYTAGSLQFSCGVDKSGQWTMFEPATDKGKKVANWKIFNPLSSATANQILDSPPPALLAEVARPAIQIVLTRKAGGKETFRFAKPAGKSVYLWVSDGSGLYRVGKDTYDSLVFKSPADILR